MANESATGSEAGQNYNEYDQIDNWN